MAAGIHLIPSRTQKLSPHTANIVPGKPGAKIARRPLFLRITLRSSCYAGCFRFGFGVLHFSMTHDFDSEE